MYIHILFLNVFKDVWYVFVVYYRLISGNFRENHFSYIFIDEASQATEPQMLIPLTITSEVAETNKFQAQIVIAGDPYQLGPIVRCKEIKHIYGKFSQQ